MQLQLTDLPLDKMVTISQTTVSEAFSWIKMFNIFIIIPLTFVPNIDLDNGLMPNIQKAIICTKAYPIHRRIYAAPGGYGLRGNSTIT